MTDNNRIRKGSLQFYPRVRAKKVVPRVNWKPVNKGGSGSVGLGGFVGYKVGMVSVWVKDNTEHSLTKGKRIAVPATVLECPSMKIYAVRFYKDNKVFKDLVVAHDKVLKRKVKLSKKKGEVKLDEVKDFDEVRVLLYTDTKSISVDKNKPDMVEVALSGSNDDKMAFIKDHVGKDISVTDVFSEGVVDVRGVTKGYGTQGPVKRFGISLKDSKSEKGQRRPGSLAPWHPARVTFRAPQAGQTGYHKRITYNNLILKVGKTSEEDITPKGGFDHYGQVKTDYIILKGSLPGPRKRGLVITPAMRPAKKIAKQNYEVVEIR